MRFVSANLVAARARRRSAAFRVALPLACLLFAVGAVADPSGFGEETDLSIAVQFPLMLKILQFDRNLPSRAGSEIVVAAVYQGRYRASVRARDEVHRAASANPNPRVADLPVRIVDVDIERIDLKEALDSLDVDVVYLTPLRAMDIVSITRVTRELRIGSMTGVEDYVHQGVAVGLGVWQEKPRVLVNLDASKAEGADFSSRLLSLAQLVK